MSNSAGTAPPVHVQKTIAPNHYTVTEFAKKKSVSRTVVYKHIEEGKIIPDLVGADKVIMIDWTLYKDHEFATPRWSKEKFLQQQKDEAKG